jgi:serine/threonine protein kinase
MFRDEHNTNDLVLRVSHGTPGYLAPEIFGDDGFSQTVDLWALGVAVYVMFVRSFPFSPGDLDAMRSGEFDLQEAELEKVGAPEPARLFIRDLLLPDPACRLTAKSALEHDWMLPLDKVLQQTHTLVSALNVGSALNVDSAAGRDPMDDAEKYSPDPGG